MIERHWGESFGREADFRLGLGRGGHPGDGGHFAFGLADRFAFGLGAGARTSGWVKS